MIGSSSLVHKHAHFPIGHVPKPLVPAFAKWLRGHSVKGTIERLNGKPERPLVYLFEVN